MVIRAGLTVLAKNTLARWALAKLAFKSSFLMKNTHKIKNMRWDGVIKSQISEITKMKDKSKKHKGR